ncbi:MAG: hypothetical protein LBR53_12505 [Deltaproteobacteria bacterium]|jgi:hypothetical protein|nr:hypothetical protein [Deltaproteobacteria bacterium]
MLHKFDADSIGSHFIRYQFKGKGETKHEYGLIQKSVWVKGTCKSETVLWLGKVLNKDELIFHSRKHGVYKFIPPSTIKPLSSDEIAYRGFAAKPAKAPLVGEELVEIYEPLNCLSFGGVYVASEVIKESGLEDIFMKPFENEDNLGEAVMSLVLYNLTDGGATMRALSWWNETYAKFLYHDVDLISFIISRLYKEIGKDKYWRIFFEKYSQFLNKESPLSCALIDSTGLPNAVQTGVTQFRDYVGKDGKQIRLIIVQDKNSGYPLFLNTYLVILAIKLL